MLEEMDPEDLESFWLLWQVEPWGARSEEVRLGRAVGAIANKNWWDIFPGRQHENVPEPVMPKVSVDDVVAYWFKAVDRYNKAV